ncbi:hypothetical protein LCGC14_1042270 [marine sediment metagenome]|uniref:Uncharacterized protein n=1 Tax=marine sediment metagenome TaxID=412755 RepID=A0A0F9Q9M7_9ZZZZ
MDKDNDIPCITQIQQHYQIGSLLRLCTDTGQELDIDRTHLYQLLKKEFKMVNPDHPDHK